MSKINTEMHIFEKPSLPTMLSKTEKIFSIIFSLIVIAELISGAFSSLYELHYICKPAIVTALIFFFWTHSKPLNVKLRYLVTFALLFSLLGDILLMFVDLSPQYFLLGLVAFLMAHILYVFSFLKHRNPTLRPWGLIILLLGYALGLFYVLKAGLNEMRIPVVIYMLAILSMSTTAYLRKGQVPKPSYVLVFVGAIFFMISDSILALNKFYMVLPYANISIMLTYAIAQYCIVIGILKGLEQSR